MKLSLKTDVVSAKAHGLQDAWLGLGQDMLMKFPGHRMKESGVWKGHVFCPVNCHWAGLSLVFPLLSN